MFYDNRQWEQMFQEIDRVFKLNSTKDDFDTEVQTYEKEDKIITVTTYFDKKGNLIGTESFQRNKEDEKTIRTNQLRTELKEAVLKEDFLRAAEIKKQIEKL